MRRVDGTAKSVRVIGKGNKERWVPLPEAFGPVFGFWLKDRPRGEAVFAKADGKPISPQAARAYLRGMLEKAGIEKKISPHKLRHTETPPTSSTPGPNGWTSRRCWIMRASPPPRLTPTSGRRGWSRWWGGCEGRSGAHGKRQDLTPSTRSCARPSP